MNSDICQLAGDDCIQIATVENLNQYSHLQSPGPPSARHQLPRDIVDFTGRKEQLEKANTLIDSEIGAKRTAPPILAIYGMPGVGKSAFAIHLAHLQENRFPYAQLYVDLREKDGRNKDPYNILADFLRVLGVDERFIPTDLNNRASIFRSQLNDKKALILLDNAGDISQIRPLLPGSSSCAVIITSRRPLSALEGTNPLNLGILSEDEALSFLIQLIGNDRIQFEPEEAMRVIALCGQLPLAIRIVGGTMREKPHWKLGYYVNRLADEKKRLGQLKLDDLDVRASFNISYSELSLVEARLFRLLNVLDVNDFSCEIAKAILNLEDNDTVDEIEVLVKVQLLEPIGEGRYRFHDLVRLYSKELLEKKEKPKTRNAARLRVINWYAKKSYELALLFYPDNSGQVSNLLPVGSDKLADAERIDLQNALTWFELERRNLINLVESANTLAEYKIVWLLANHLFPFLGYREFWTDIVYINKKALEAVNKVGDQSGKGIILNNLGNGYRSIRKWQDAISCFEQSLDINIKLRDRQGESTVLMNIGAVFLRQHKYPEAIEKYEESIAIRREIKDLFGESQTLIGLASVYDEMGVLEKSVELLNQSITISKIQGDLFHEGMALGNLGMTYNKMKRFDDAILCYKEALRVSRELGNRHRESNTLWNLGNLLTNRGDLTKAITKYEESISIMREIGFNHGDGNIFDNLGLVYAKSGMWSKAIEECEEGLRIERGLGDRYGESKTRVNLGIIYYGQRLWPEALKEYKMALGILRDLGDSHGEGMCQANIGAVYRECSQIDKAIIAWRDALGKLPVCSEEYRKVDGWIASNQSEPCDQTKGSCD